MNDHITSTITDARSIALDVLEDVLKRKRPLEEAVAHKRDIGKLPDRDRQFVHLLIMTTLRHLGEIDHVLGQFLQTPLPSRAFQARDILRLGVAQSLFLNTPDHASVDTMVSLAGRRHDSKPFKGLINAVLRRVVREKGRLLTSPPQEAVSLPEWLWQSWVKTYGLPQSKAISLAHLTEPPLDFSVKGDLAFWAERLHAMILPTGSLRLPASQERPHRIEDLPGYRDGAWWVQDLSASLPVKLAGPIAGQRILDMCSAPGGKTAQLAAAGAQVLALERARGRMERLKQNMNRLKLAVDFDLADAALWSGSGNFDLVLLDAPCSATGTMRRRPDVAWIKNPKEIPSLVKAQEQLLEAALKHLRPGGRLIYCVCSLQHEEGPAQIGRFLERHRNVRRQPLRQEELPGLEFLVTSLGDMQALPHYLADIGGMDGFYAARLIVE